MKSGFINLAPRTKDINNLSPEKVWKHAKIHEVKDGLVAFLRRVGLRI